jgi:acetylornithine deacetylase/succinyl-diaminopimelate desuccinylase-like protein
LGGTEARLWRKFGVPAITYGPNHHNMGSPNEYIVADELKKVLRVHSLTALRFIKQKSNN